MKNMDYLDEESTVSTELDEFSKKSASRQIKEYQETILSESTNIKNTGDFWKKTPELVLYLLTVPANSTAVKRNFSVGGFILR